jgi:tetratricopeptide (TPR) repeat protein
VIQFHAGLWKALGFDILGKAALAEGSYSEAEGHFQDCLNIYQTIAQREKISETWACLGYIARKRGQITQAQDYFFRALELAIKVWALPTLSHALPGIALLFADLGDDEHAVEIYILASTLGMVANSKWFADIAGEEIAEIAAGLPAEVVDAAKGRVQEPFSWEKAESLLQELKKWGWSNADRKFDVTTPNLEKESKSD